jgi:hypothetical protein
MASDDKKTKATPAPKAETAAPIKEASAAKSAPAEKPRADSSEPATAPKSYSRGEGQKPVSRAYKDNWNAIFGKKSKKKKR